MIDLLTGRLIDAGFAPDEAASRARLVDQAIAGFAGIAMRPPARAWFVPGRIEVFGKHTDYAGGRSLLAAVPRGFAVAAAPRDDGRVRVMDVRWHDAMEFDPTDETAQFTGWMNYIAVVARRLASNFPGAPLGLDIAFASDLPRAAGLSSSSALVVGLATAFIDRAQLRERPEWHAAIHTPLDLAGYLGAVENGLTFPGLAGTSGVGTHGGSEDHTAILTCQADRLSAYAYVPVRFLGEAPWPAEWRFVVAATGIQADKAGSAKARYNRASLATRALLDLWQLRTGKAAPTLAAALGAAVDAPERLAGLAAASTGGDFSAADLTRRLAHFLAEDARVLAAADAVRTRDAAAIGALADASQSDAETLLGNQIPETTTLARLARQHGALASSSFGAGFGGSVWAIARADEAAAFARRWLAAYQAVVPAVGEVEWFITRPSPAATDLGAIS